MAAGGNAAQPGQPCHEIKPALDIAYTEKNLDNVPIKTVMGSNWCGYAAMTNFDFPTVNSVKEVKGSWKVPKLSTRKNNTQMDMFIGIDGFSNQTIELIGTAHDIVDGKQVNYAWFHIYPANSHSIKIKHFPVDVGDTLEAKVRYLKDGFFEMVIKNCSKGITFVVPKKYTKNVTAERTSAQWIVEAPTIEENDVLLNDLADFGTVRFTDCSATISGKKGPIQSKNWVNSSLTMRIRNPSNNAPLYFKAFPSTLSSRKDSFTVTWKHH
jgi:hypothetical protein